jgi:hypothetical protein
MICRPTSSINSVSLNRNFCIILVLNQHSVLVLNFAVICFSRGD